MSDWEDLRHVPFKARKVISSPPYASPSLLTQFRSLFIAIGQEMTRIASDACREILAQYADNNDLGKLIDRLHEVDISRPVGDPAVRGDHLGRCQQHLTRIIKHHPRIATDKYEYGIDVQVKYCEGRCVEIHGDSKISKVVSLQFQASLEIRRENPGYEPDVAAPVHIVAGVYLRKQEGRMLPLPVGIDLSSRESLEPSTARSSLDLSRLSEGRTLPGSFPLTVNMDYSSVIPGDPATVENPSQMASHSSGSVVYTPAASEASSENQDKVSGWLARVSPILGSCSLTVAVPRKLRYRSRISTLEN